MTGWTAKSAGPLPEIKGPVHLSFWVPERGVSPRLDLDNCSKAFCDLLVSLGVIEDDNRKIVRSLCLHWIDAKEGWADVTSLEKP